jgi:cytochrome c6
MKKVFISLAIISTLCFPVLNSSADQTVSMGQGETKFNQQCAVCHPNGDNIINPKKTLHKRDRDANNVKTADDVVKIMRNPGPGMTKFDIKTIPDSEAQAIAHFVLKTF